MAPVLSLTEAPEHPHLAARGTFIRHSGITQPAPAPRFSGTPTGVTRGPAQPGAHAAEVARDWDLPALAAPAAAESADASAAPPRAPVPPAGTPRGEQPTP